MFESIERLEWKRIFLIVALVCISVQVAPIWTDFKSLRMGQQTIYDNIYIPMGVNTQVDITYKTAFSSYVSDHHQALMISGFQNYLQFQMIINVTILDCNQGRIKINIYTGPLTSLKQLKINYLVITDIEAEPLYSNVQVLTGSNQFVIKDYRTLDLDDPNGLRKQTFTNQTSTLVDVKSYCSGIYGFQYSNNHGTVNEINVNTEYVPTGKVVKQEVIVGEKGKLTYISITTILIQAAFFPNVNYLNFGYTFQTTMDGTNGLDELQKMSDGGLFSQTDNSLFFGIRGFNFTMEGSRVFLLDIGTKAIFSENLATQNNMKYVQLSFLLLVKRACPGTEPLYYVEGYSCQTSPCTDLYEDGTNQLCWDCASVCDECSGSAGGCVACQPALNRVLSTASPLPPITCVCDYDNGYVEVDEKDLCQLCSDHIPGCLKCLTSTSCDDCGDITIYDRILQPDMVSYRCGCLDNKYLVTGKCLSYPGCIKANQYVTGQFCQQCDKDNNFEKDLTNNSSCKCKIAYFPHPTNKSKCIDLCGDSRTPESPANAKQSEIICDDGNTKNGDGCSSTCRQQFGYICTVDKKGQISKCAQKQQITFQYLYSEKNLISNQAKIVFALKPPQNSLAENTFATAINIKNFPGSKTITFDPKTSLIIITVDYFETIQDRQFDFIFSPKGLKIYFQQITHKTKLNGRNAKLQIGYAHPQVNIITYIALAVSAFALLLALTSAFLGQKMIGIELILPIQAAYFSLVTLPKGILSPISALWSLKFSNGYNSLDKFDLTTNYMLDSRVTLLQYAGQYILNYNLMFSLLALVMLIMLMTVIRIAWLERQQSRIQQTLKKIEEDQKQTKQEESKKQSKKQKDQKEISDEEQKLTGNQDSDKANTQKENQIQMLNEQIDDVRQNITNWKNFLYMIFDRFFTILIVTAMMKVIFCFYLQTSNLTYSTEVISNSLNASFFFLTYATIVTGLYAIIYDYKTDKFINFNCNKGKYAMFYIILYLAFIIFLGGFFSNSFTIYVIIIFPILSLILIPYQKPYGIKLFDFQTIIAFICQFPFLVTVVISLILNLQKDSFTQQTSTIFAYAIIGTMGITIILTIVRMIKVIDCKNVSCIQFVERKKDNKKDKKKKKNKIIVLDQMDLPKNDWDQFQHDSVRSLIREKRQEDENQSFNIDKQSKEAYEAIAKKNEPQSLQKQKQKPKADDQDEQDIDQLEKIKIKLRKDLKQKKMVGKIR